MVDPGCNPRLITGCLVHLQLRLGHLEFEWKKHAELLLVIARLLAGGPVQSRINTLRVLEECVK